MNTPRMCRGTPNQFSENGVSNTTTSNGTIKILSNVRAFGRFTFNCLIDGSSIFDRSVELAKKRCQSNTGSDSGTFCQLGVNTTDNLECIVRRTSVCRVTGFELCGRKHAVGHPRQTKVRRIRTPSSKKSKHE